jgi:agmatinase
MSLTDKIATFDPNDLGRAGSNLFGLPFTPDEARVVVVPVPWEVTVSYGGGTLGGPRAVFEASKQVDLYDPYLPDAWKTGVAMEPVPARLAATSRALRGKAERYIARLERGGDPARDPVLRRIQSAINAACAAMVDDVERRTARRLAEGKLVALLGGDHSTPLGFMKALARRHRAYGVLQIDAHADLRDAYEGFTYSHASIMFNALRIPQIKRLVQAGIRDYCEAEADLIRASKGRVVTWFDRDIKHQLYRGKTVAALHRTIVSKLPDKVYVSFDIDGLDPKLCPNTGTPVPGGFEFEEAVHLVQAVADSGRTIIGLDINEVSPGRDEWDANVGARLLFRLINIMARSQCIRP